MNVMRRIETGPKSLHIEYRPGDNGIEADAGNGVTIVAHADGAIQLALYWSDDETGERHTVHISESEPRLLSALAVALDSMAIRARRGEGALTEIKIRSRDERTTQH